MKREEWLHLYDETQRNDILRRLWTVARKEELTTDTTALLDALVTLNGEPHVLLGDILDAMKLLPRDGTSALDAIVIQHEAVERRIDEEVKWVLEREESLGRWMDFTSHLIPEPV